MRAAAGDLQEVFGPESASILQGISNVGLFLSRKVFDLTENSTVTQITDIPLQPLLHKPEACQ